MRLRTLLSAVAVAAASAAGAQTVELNVISRVAVEDAGNEVLVSIKGSKPPNFTTFSMMDPPRFVIDISESTFQNVPEDVTGPGGLIQVVKNLSYGSEATSIARVMIAFTREVDPPDVQTTGNDLLVRVAKPAEMGVAQRAAPAPRGAPAATAAAGPTAAEKARARAEAEAKAKAEVEAELRAQAELEARAAAEAEALARAQAEQDRARVAEAQAQAKALAAQDARARQEAEAQAKAQAAEEAKARREAEAQAKADAKAQAAEEKRLKAEEAKARREADAQAKADAKAQAAEEKRLKAEEAKARREAEAQAKAEAKALAAEEKRLKAEEARALKVASLPPSEPRTEVLAPTGAPNQVREVGFQQLPGASRVFVRTAQEPRFTILEAGENLIRIELANTRVKRRNDARFMDTSFFPSAVALVTPRREGSTYVVEIKLKERVPYQQKVEGDMLAIDFQRPAGLSAPPGEAAPGEPAPADAEPGEAPPPGGR